MRDILTYFLFILLFIGRGEALAELSKIPLDDIRIPSNDLVYKDKFLTAEKAWQLKREGLDLSALDPYESEVWQNRLVHDLGDESDRLPIKSGGEVNYISAIQSHSGLLRFNALLNSRGLNKTYTVHLDKRLHSTLLRKNLLRKLGYIVPKMKYLSTLKVNFKTKKERDCFIEKDIHYNAQGTPKRWVLEYEKIKNELDCKGKKDITVSDPLLTLTLQDVAVTMPSEKDHFNLAIYPPPMRLSHRTLRSLIVPYALLDVKESINKLNWVVGRIENDHVLLPHFTRTRFNATYDDLLWAVRRLMALSREDFEEIVKKAHYPRPVEKVLVEKIVSRRNSLLDLLGIEFSKISFNTEISYGENLKEGKLLKEDWQGYASRFAHGDPDSPFKGFGYYLFSSAQSSVLDWLTEKASEELQGFDIAEARGEFLQEQFEEGLDHFVETGELIDFGVGTWVSPYANGKIIASRDIVIGNFMGTDNLVQLADTVGMGFSFGAHVGIEKWASEYSGFARGGINIVKTWTHLKPVKSLKASVKEPYKNMYVPLLKKNIEKELAKLGSINDEFGPDEQDERDEVLAGIMDEIGENLGVGESLLMIERATPSFLAGGNLNLMETRFSLSGGAEGIIVSRIQIYRKDGDTIQVYVDKGEAGSLFINYGFDYYVPILNIISKTTKGKYDVEMYNVNIDTNEEINPNLYKNANALNLLLKDGTTELLKESTKPFKVENEFLDKSSKFSLLFWKSKYIQGNGLFSITNPFNHTSHFLKVTENWQGGVNYKDFTYEVANYYLNKLLMEIDDGKYVGIELDSNRWQNPAQSFLGSANTKTVRFEAKLESYDEKSETGELDIPFISITDQKEAWSKSKKRVQKEMIRVNQRFKENLFSRDSVEDAEGLKLFNLQVHMNIYERGVKRIMNIPQKIIKLFQKKYISERRSNYRCRHARERARYRNTSACGSLGRLLRQNNRCRGYKKEGDIKSYARCIAHFARLLERDLEYEDLKRIVGEDNIYIYATIDGFRDESETLNATIKSNTLGHISSRHWNGPLEKLKEIMGMQNGEFNGLWIRESL